MMVKGTLLEGINKEQWDRIVTPINDIMDEAMTEWIKESERRVVKLTLEEIWEEVTERLDMDKFTDKFTEQEVEWVKGTFLKRVESYFRPMSRCLHLQKNGVFRVRKIKTLDDYFAYIKKNPDYEKRVKKFFEE